jgi:hypothetical protein
MNRLASATLLTVALIAPANAVIILESTYEAEGYAASEALAAEPQFAAIFALCDRVNEGCGNASGTWIGNDDEHGYILTAAHAFDGDDYAARWAYRSRAGKYYTAVDVAVHPGYVRAEATKQESAYSLGFDIALVTLSEPVDDAGEPPLLYSGSDEQGMTLTFIGYGTRGSAGKGEDENEPAGEVAAAAQGVVDRVLPLVLNELGEADGNSLEVFLPKEDGSVVNPITGAKGDKPVSDNAGLLGGGDSGGSAWIETDAGWAIAGINGDGSGKAQYGDTSGFARVSGHIAWITELFPGARTE